MKSKMLGALALLTLIGALFVMQTADQRVPSVDAATGSIDALNVGTCLTTNDDVPNFSGACGALDDSVEGRDIRDKIAEVTTLYATYAHDPKTASDEPRAILKDSDLLKISVADSGRDKRTGVLIRGATNGNNVVDIGDDDIAGSLGAIIRKDLADDKLNFEESGADIDTSNTAIGDTDAEAKDIIFSSNEDGADGIWMYRRQTNAPDNTGSSIIGNSGTATLNFERAGSPLTTPDVADDTWQFDPGDFKVKSGAVVRFYGCVDLDSNLNSGDSCDPDGDDNRTGTTSSDADNEPYINLKDYITVDEDASNGEASGNTAPWVAINASVPAGSDVVILAIYYRTSNIENLVGGEAYRHCAVNSGTPPAPKWSDNAWSCDSGTLTERKADTNVVYTSDETSGSSNTALKVEASSDGVPRSVNLYLTETGRFSGVYQGQLRLTDADGDGRTNGGTTANNWGRVVGSGMEDDPSTTNVDESIAILGVESGPVTITYRDTSGGTKTLRIEIDKQPPTINVDSPANGSSSGDQSPDFSGTIEDLDSGLADNSFRLVVDNKVDNDGSNSDNALDDKAPTAEEVKGKGADGTGAVSHIGEYTGHAADADGTVGITDAAVLYKLGDDACQDTGDYLCHITAEAYDDGANRGTFDDSVRLDLQDASGDAEIRDKEYEIDFQAFVMDMAGNIGFSDSDPANPRFINDLGEEKVKDRKKPNVLGYYSSHVVILDEKDPEIITTETATGYYGRSNDKNVADRYGVMVVFDGPVDSSSVSTSTFTVELDDKSMANVVDVDVNKKYVFLKLASELASDATPMIDIAAGEKVEDMAGNETFGKEVKAFEANDGISPKLTVTLSGGSGSGIGKEGPASLTKDKITVHVASDEALQGAPRIIVACSSLRWNEGGTKDTDGNVYENLVGSKHDIDDFVANRNGTFTSKPSEDPVTTKPRSTNAKAITAKETYRYTCGYDRNKTNFGDDFGLTEVSSLSRPGENWEYTWQNQSNEKLTLADGKLTAVAFARDRSKYGAASMENWGSSSAEFTLDTELKDPTQDGGGDLQPEDGGTSKEDRPFVLIEFNENTSVTLESVEIDDVEVASEFDEPQMGRFVYWPESLSKGKHEVAVKALDAAGNDRVFEFSFTVESRGKFLIELQAGWNAISVPADPVDTAIGSVFSDPAIETVIGWDTQGWRIAVRRDGVWESNHQYGALNEIRAKYGYWVKSGAFIDQPVSLKGPISRSLSGAPTLLGIDTNPGWNFVGVIDQQGTQTEDDFGETLKDSHDKPLTASEYLNPNYVRAYTWDPTFSRFEVLRENDTMTIGKGVWVYYPETGGIAP